MDADVFVSCKTWDSRGVGWLCFGERDEGVKSTVVSSSLSEEE